MCPQFDISTNISWSKSSLINMAPVQQNGAISVPDTVEDDGEGSDGTPSDDLESNVAAVSNKGAVKFGWIRGVLVSYVGSCQAPSAL